MDIAKIWKSFLVLVVGIACDGLVLAFGMDANIPEWVLLLLLAIFTFGSITGIIFILKRNNDD